MKKFHMISGLPRSGSTLLCNLLNMNPMFHATPTSAIVDSLRNIRSTFSHNPTWKAQDREALMENMRMASKGFIEGFYHDKEVVFDKCRGWTNNLSLIDEIFKNKDTKIVWTYRNPVEVVNSIEARYQKTILLENADEASNSQAFVTLDRRVGTYTGEGSIINYPIEILRDAIEMGYGDRIFFISYYDLCNSTQQVMDMVHDFLGEDKYQYDTKNLKQTIHEYDGLYNYKFMHKIKEGEVKYSETEIVLPQKYVDIINNKYAPLNNFIINGDIEGFLNITLPKKDDESEEKSLEK